MDDFFEGEISIDENLYLVKEARELYNHLKVDMYAPLSDCVHTDDLPRLKEILDSVNNGGSNDTCAIRMLCQDDTYRWFMITAKKELFEIKGQNVITLLISDWLLQSDYTNLLMEKVSYNDAYLQMLEGILLCYDRGSDYLDVFVQNDSRHVSLFRGSIAKWKQYCSDNRVAKRDLPALLEFCEDLKAGRNGQYDILTNMFSKQGKERLFTFKCNMISGQNQIILGCAIPHTQSRADLLGETYEKDVGVDALNKKAITDYAKKTIHAAGNDKKVYIGIIDLDNFKTINDTLGHLFGDEVLRVITDIVKKALGSQGMLGRIGGDELMIVVDQISDYTELRNLLRTIRTNVEWAYKGKRDDVITTCSIGISCYPDQGSTFEEVFKVSDRMLYLAKEKGKNRYVIYTPSLHDAPKQSDSSNAKAQDIDAEQFKNNKLGILQKMVDNYLLRKEITNEVMFREIGLGFELQEILYASDENGTVQWTPEGTSYDANAIHAFRMDDNFVSCFDKNGLYVMNNYSYLEGKSPKIAEALKSRGVQSVILYRLAQSNGYIMFARKNFRQLWSEYDIMAFGIIAKTIEIAIASR